MYPLQNAVASSRNWVGWRLLDKSVATNRIRPTAPGDQGGVSRTNIGNSYTFLKRNLSQNCVQRNILGLK